MYKILFFISVGIILILILLIISTVTKINYIKKILEDVIAGNFSRKIMINNNFKFIANLVSNINLITDKLQEAKNDNLEKADIMSKMVSNISHDFKTPLTSLIGYVELIKQSKNLSLEEINEYLDIIHNKACYLNSTLENFFYLSRLEANDEKFNIQKINLSDVIQEQVLFFYNDFKTIGITPVLECPKEEVYVLADRVSVGRILNNLLSNSLKYGKDGNKVGIHIYEDKDYIYTEVWNNGKGIDKKDLPLVFNRLYTAEESRNSKLSGNGIGLSIVKELVKGNKGSISVKSISFKKTAFTFSLPKINL
ncbi:sensor histidine kinase [Clostridium felsineum]|uniref:histidine kinase n=1 Tax=Clostridium felsineum TaxID=36839 RepID=A0A1S8M7E4_9CLOT|nr:HAMP domain-containing sensor histidine kinase [Clostridium felsineum]MCR3760974.1 HAMP domain-containing histidine kinase [Clostridium felsineum]URZ05258.1 Adaptive-response sensory-kinase SasA [Clostridium felsineum]URZ10299.1 Adaptive-response sensory-kinase SasA [Clostridium felsineum]